MITFEKLVAQVIASSLGIEEKRARRLFWAAFGCFVAGLAVYAVIADRIEGGAGGYTPVHSAATRTR
jgi:hypothetical protein